MKAIPENEPERMGRIMFGSAPRATAFVGVLGMVSGALALQPLIPRLDPKFVSLALASGKSERDLIPSSERRRRERPSESRPFTKKLSARDET